MSTAADVIVVGAGHNGLVAACYLARAGRKVLVLEASETFGGMTSTNAVFPNAPQHRINEGGMDVTLLRASSIVADLELERHGFGQIEVDPPYAFLQPDGSSLCIWRDPQKTADEIHHFSKRDAAAYLEFANSIDLMMNVVLPYMRSHPLRINVWEMFVGFLKLLRYPRRLWGLNRFISASHAEYIEENFEHPMVRGPLAAIPPFLPIQTEGTAWMLVYFGLIHRIGVSRVKTGTGGLTDALARSLQASHGTIRTGARVESVLVENRRASGVRLVGGEELRAKAVVTACNVKYALQELVPTGALTRREEVQANRIPIAASRATSFKIDFALKAPIRLSKHQAWRKDDVDLRKPGLCWVNYDQHVTAWDDCANGRLPNPLPSFVLLPTAVDPTQAPAGQDTLWYWSGIAPSHPQEPWTTLKERATREVLQDMGQYFDDVEGITIARRVMSPDDLAERFTVPHGNVYHVDTGISRFGPFRPSERFSGFTTSIDNLFLSGGGMHPSAGIAGIPGQLAARTVLRKMA